MESMCDAGTAVGATFGDGANYRMRTVPTIRNDGGDPVSGLFTDDPATAATAQALLECPRTKNRHASCSRIAWHRWLGGCMDAASEFGGDPLTAGEVTSFGVDEFTLQVLHFRVDVASKNHEYKTL